MLVGDRMKFNTVLITLKHKFANAEPTYFFHFKVSKKKKRI